MKTAIIGLFLFFSRSVSAQAPEPVPLARGSVPGEPHHHLKIENEYVRAYYVEVPPHEATQLHQHDHDYIYVSLGQSDVVNAVLNKPEVHLVLKDGETHFTRGGFAHVARNLADTPFRNVTIELLKRQDEPRNRCENVVPGDKSSCTVERDASSYTITSLFETAEISLLLVKLRPKAVLQEFPDRDRLLVALDHATLVVQTQGKAEANLSGGDSVWLSRLTSQKIQNSVNSPSSFLSIAFKDSGPARVY
jgi:quercetin dioxygenase-like cupin family protein